MRILVDGDSCPIKDLIIDLAAKANCQVLFISSLAHWSAKYDNDFVKSITVDSCPEAVDMKIVNLAKKGDLVVTQDYGLAALLLPKQVQVISPRGKIFDDNNIDYLLAKRHHTAKLRRGGEYIKGSHKYSQIDKNRFIDNFKILL
ncbi:YaiI/YqxD family protein [Fuchsiella alkaliacetigena]|uniref:YaiI/YqxD family protein n=1 Tax=Fuchsiella alkaliacetigena TaxID=957042 RepID=UPI00200A6A24|nr:YaiI/YqxD family protein [Fuchsiella alkaliacetigena]MCK8824483.1 YaiI/YqxD family protein [Fuchsiella alkaliacetigena]